MEGSLVISCQQVKPAHPARHLLYVSCERFVRLSFSFFPLTILCGQDKLWRWPETPWFASNKATLEVFSAKSLQAAIRPEISGNYLLIQSKDDDRNQKRVQNTKKPGEDGPSAGRLDCSGRTCGMSR
jgi:hypothetical protein